MFVKTIFENILECNITMININQYTNFALIHTFTCTQEKGSAKEKSNSNRNSKCTHLNQ